MTIHFLSPLPPKKTGTADYISQLLDELVSKFGTDIQNSIMLWDRLASRTDAEAIREKGWRVGDIRTAEFFSDDLVVLFLASNDFHDWVWEILASRGDYVVCSVIHDLTAFPLIRKLVRDKHNLLSAGDEILALSYEFRDKAAWISENYNLLTDVAKYFIMGQGVTLARSDHVIVHSHYAKRRLEVECAGDCRSENPPVSQSGSRSLPPIWVCNHPHISTNPNPSLVSRLLEADVFCIGSVGFYSRIKRNDVVLEAFGAFVSSLSRDEREHVRLAFIGKISDSLRLEAEEIVGRHDLADLVLFTGFVNEDVLQAWQARLDLQINLRFPSCGETSGTLARAHAMNKRVVCSAFAAFREEPCTWSISTDRFEEFNQLVNIMSTEFKRWKLASTEPSAHTLSRGRKPAFSEVLSKIAPCGSSNGRGQRD